MARYLVENGRPRKVVTIFARVLASASSSTKGVGRMWLDEEQFRASFVQSKLALGHLKLVQTLVSAVPREAAPEAAPMSEVVEKVGDPTDAVPASEVETARTETPAPVVEVVVPEAPSAEVPVEPAAAEETTPNPELVKLQASTLKDLRALAKDLGLATTGNKDELADRIFASQQGTP